MASQILTAKVGSKPFFGFTPSPVSLKMGYPWIRCPSSQQLPVNRVEFGKKVVVAWRNWQKESCRWGLCIERGVEDFVDCMKCGLSRTQKFQKLSKKLIIKAII